MQILREREKISKVLSMDALAVPFFCTTSFPSVDVLLIFTDVEAELGKLVPDIRSIFLFFFF